MQTKSVRYLLWGSVGIAVAAALAFAFRPQPVAVDLTTVRNDRIVITVADEGEAEVREVYRISAPLEGRLLRVEGEVGDPVVAGKTEVAKIEPTAPVFLDVRTETEARAAVEAAKAGHSAAVAEWERAQAEREFTTKEVERSRILLAKGHVSKQKLDTDERAYRVAVADLLTAQARLDQRMHELEVAEARLVSPIGAGDNPLGCECLILRAPVNGEILQVIEESETILQPGAGILEIGDPNNLQIVVDLLSEDAVRVTSGQPAVIDGWGGVPLNGVVRRVEPFGYTKVSALGIEEQRVDVVLDLTDPPETWSRLGHGYRVDVSIILNDLQGLSVPLGAVFRVGEDWSVFVVRDGRAQRQIVELGARNADKAEVLSGLADGDTLIMHPSDQIDDGIRVEAR